jgi:peptide/nickel transport system ATP-binding protein
VMRHGRIVESGALSDILAHPKQPYTRELLDANLSRRLASTHPHEPVEANA